MRREIPPRPPLEKGGENPPRSIGGSPPLSKGGQGGFLHSQHVQRRLRVTGIVQGVGFRPTVWHLASELKLAGWVRNDAAGVEVLLDGDEAAIAAFTRRLPKELPPLAQVRDLTWKDAPASGEFSTFDILESGAGPAATMIGFDTAVCPDCLAELFDPADRRWRYAFINCTHCGPRYTLTRKLPYDRAQTSMAAFPLCPDCEREYRDPADRRFHAEPTACAVCGPGLWLSDLVAPASSRLFEKTPARMPALQQDPIADTLSRFQSGQIVAIKGLGGFHLACDARDPATVQRLRERKNREEKPFAVMVVNLASIADWVDISPEEAELLQAPERPIVLLRKKPGADALFPGIAPGLAWLGVMLPYTPIHWLLFHEAAGRPDGTAWMAQQQTLALVMTSANPGGEPLVIGNDEARERLAGIADAVLLHDRDIVVRCDDSVVRCVEQIPDEAPTLRYPGPPLKKGGANPPRSIEGFPPLPKGGQGGFAPFTQFIRRARGYTPRAIRLPHSGPSVLALGGYLKNTICVTRGDEAFVSQHIGGLDNPATCAMLIEVAGHLLDILQVRPEAVVHDLHPDFFSSRHALELADRWSVPSVAVQHHHAHIAAVAAEQGVTGPLLGLALDGVGLGSDGSAWGGELLCVEGANFTRLGYLAPIPLPGGDKAASQPWRMAAAALHLMGRGDEIARRFPDQPAAAQLQQLLERGLNCPPTSSLGRCFDAAAGLLGARAVMAYEGQAAMLLEGLAEAADRVAPLAGGYVLHDDGRLDLLPLLARLADEKDAAFGAALFHATLAQGLAEWLERAAVSEGLTTVALGGGCFLNHILSRELSRLLVARGFTVLSARQAPPNDGGLSLGQAWVAMQKLTEKD
ncbi:MAG: carbamoyltransferase HypF [Pseudomonadota bacterium]|nr:carbamoyltransferase HypF [Pseudomonadota bacterium]MDP1904692.1 carbamoyltransferase HypF [Pseudomonadota bacterium]MDP2352882.1 carbamoyltransferase HypF [Pseudomonadota bacterium]